MRVNRLKDAVEVNIKKLTDCARVIDIESPAIYGNWLAQTYYFVCHSTRLLALASSRFPLKQNELHYRCAEHVKEEKGHEKLAINDLRAIGCSINNFPELTMTKAFYQTQYYQIEHVGAIAFWGYIFCLEAFAVSAGVDIYKKVLNCYGDKAASFLRIHTVEDVGHLEKAYKTLDKIDDQDYSKVIENLNLSSELYGAIYSEINKSSQVVKKYEAA